MRVGDRAVRQRVGKFRRLDGADEDVELVVDTDEAVGFSGSGAGAGSAAGGGAWGVRQLRPSAMSAKGAVAAMTQSRWMKFASLIARSRPPSPPTNSRSPSPRRRGGWRRGRTRLGVAARGSGRRGPRRCGAAPRPPRPGASRARRRGAAASWRSRTRPRASCVACVV